MILFLAALALQPASTPAPGAAPTAVTWPTQEGDVSLANFKFRSGETVPRLNMHYTTLGKPHRNAAGEIDNAVMVLHGTGGSGQQFLRPQFADELYGPGQPLDINRYWIILPDNIGHGKSSKPSDGLRTQFPKYDYDDMVEAQRLMLKVQRFRDRLIRHGDVGAGAEGASDLSRLIPLHGVAPRNQAFLSRPAENGTLDDGQIAVEEFVEPVAERASEPGWEARVDPVAAKQFVRCPS